MKYYLALVAVLVFSFAAAAQEARIGSAAPNFSATDMNGNAVALADLRDSVVVMTFWTTRCPICREELPKLDRVAESFRGKRVVFLSLTTDNEEKVASYLKRNPMASQILPNTFGVLLQYGERAPNGNLNVGFPAYYVIDTQGTLRYRSSGWDKTQAVSSMITKLL